MKIIIFYLYREKSNTTKEIIEKLSKKYSVVTIENEATSKEAFESEEVITHNNSLSSMYKTALNYYYDNNQDYDGVLFVDSSRQYSLSEINDVINTFSSNSNQEYLILGCRKYSYHSFFKKFVMKILNFLIRFLSGIKLDDEYSGLIILPTKFLEKYCSTKTKIGIENDFLLFAKKTDFKLLQHKLDKENIKVKKIIKYNPLFNTPNLYFVFLKYLFSAGISFIIDIGLYTLFCSIFSKSKNMYVATFAATVCARLISSVVNYIINRNTVFKSANKTSVIRFVCLCAFQMCVSAFGVSTLCKLLKISKPIISSIIKLCVDSLLFLVNYKVQHEWVFKKEI